MRTTTPRTHDTTRRRRRALGAALAILAISSIGAGSLSLAIFTSNGTATWSTGTGSIILSAAPASMTSSVAGWLPGDSEVKMITVSNDGTGDLRYAFTGSATNALGAALDVEIRLASGGSCAGFAGLTSILAAAPANAAAFGDPAQGAQPGDRDLAAGTSEDLCVQLSLPTSADNTLQGATSDVTFTFDGEQTLHN